MKKPYLSFLSPQFRCAQSKAYDLRNSRSDIISKSLPLSRSFHQISRSPASLPPKSRNRGPPSSEDTQTDFSALNVLGNATPPTTGIDACTHNGFVLNNDIRLAGCGVILVGGEAFKWRPWLGGSERRDGKNTAENKTLAENLQDFIGRWEAHDAAWGILDTVWPKPDLLILGTGGSIRPASPKTRQLLHDLGIRLEVQDTRNAAAQFNLLATERGLTQVAAALVPVGWSGR